MRLISLDSMSLFPPTLFPGIETPITYNQVFYCIVSFIDIKPDNSIQKININPLWANVHPCIKKQETKIQNEITGC